MAFTIRPKAGEEINQKEWFVDKKTILGSDNGIGP
jgi:hypothetical protein